MEEAFSQTGILSQELESKKILNKLYVEFNTVQKFSIFQLALLTQWMFKSSLRYFNILHVFEMVRGIFYES